MSKVAISTAIEAKLNENAGSGKTLSVVYAEHKVDTDTYPMATFEPSDIESDYETTSTDLRKYAFRIMIHQQFKSITKTEAISRVNSAEDAIIQSFGEAYTLGGVVDMLKIKPSVCGSYDKGNIPIYFSELVIECLESVDITS